jgi:tetratricopeptide (TPR) repeat protein
VTGEAPARFELAVSEIPAAAVARSLRSWLPIQPRELRLRGGTAEEIREKDRQHLELVHRHGLGRVLEFYDEELLPAVTRLPAGVERWALWFKLGCRAVALRSADHADQELTEQAERLQADLAGARFADDPQADRDARQQVRTFLAGHLAAAAERLRQNRQETAALRAYAVLDRLGAASPAHREAHARLRWQLEDRSPEALRVYLRARDGKGEAQNGKGEARDGVLAEIDRFLAESLATDETATPPELAERLFLNQLALCSARPPLPAWRHAGLAYLRLGQPQRALPYLERAHAINGSDGGASAFYLGQARFQAGDHPGSDAIFEEATVQGYSTVRIAAWRGLAYARIQERARALDLFEQGKAAAGQQPAGELYLNWGRACFVWGNVQDALLRFDTAAAADETDPRARYGLAVCWERLGQPEQALAELGQVVARFPRFAPAAHSLGLLLEAAGDLAAAVSHFRRAVTLSSWDPEYHLSLGLALEQAGDPEALSHLERAATAGAGGPEVLRRLALLALRQDDRQKARCWLDALMAAETPPARLVRFRTRDLASQATDAFNLGRYREAAALWQEMVQSQPGDAVVEERLALALAHDAGARLREGDLAGVGEAVERAWRLAPGLPECRYLYAVARLLDGDTSTAVPLLRSLLAEQPARPELAPLAAMASVLAGEEATEIPAPAPDVPAAHPSALLGLLRVLTAISTGRFEEAAQRCDALLEDSAAVRALGLPQGSLNALVADVKLRGTRRKRQQVVCFLEGLNARDEAGYWAPGVALARQIVATEKGLARAEEADLAELVACQDAYRGLLGATPAGDASVEMRKPLLAHYARLLVFLACHHAQKGRLAAALGVLVELTGLPLPLSGGVRDLERILRQRLAQPSHEKAFALLEEDAETARQTWEALVKQDPNDLLARHHLACLAWSRAYDAVLARQVESSLPFWREGLEHFRILYGSEAWWQAQREKGRALGTSTAHPFDEKGFEAWRRDALYQRASTLLHLIFHILAGVDLAEAQEADVLRAKGLMDLLRSSQLDAATRQRLADDLADHYLDPDPTRVPDFGRSRRRAATVLDVDPANVKARTFLLRSVTHEVGTRCQEGDRNFSGMARELAATERHAEWLEAHRSELPAEHQGRTASDLAAFYDQLGWVKHEEGQLAIEKFNNRRQGSFPEARRLLESIQQAYRDSDRWFEKSLALDPVNLRAKNLPERHRNEYPSIQKALGEIRRA